MVSEFNPDAIKLVVGLGNPGARYARTYHNAGARFVCALAGVSRARFRAARGFRAYRAAPRIFALTDSFMNESGGAVAAALRAANARPDECLVIHDDSDLPLGEIRLQFGRGSAGHHGVDSVIHSLRTKNFWRLRVGIRPSLPRMPAGGFVLRPMTRAAEEKITGAAQSFRTRLTPPGTPA